MRKSHGRVRPRTVLKLREEPNREEGPTTVHEPTISLPGGNKEINMKELAKELAPLVASAMRNNDDGKRDEKGPRSTKKKSRHERGEESEEERLGFLVSESRP